MGGDERGGERGGAGGDQPAGWIDERSRRKPDFRAEVPVKMLDGQVWWFRLPRVSFWIAPDEKGYHTFLTAPGVDGYDRLHSEYLQAVQGENERYAEFEALEAALREGQDPPPPPVEWPEYDPVILALMRMVRALVLANYELSAEELPRVVRVGYLTDHDPDAVELTRQLSQIATGSAPKPQGGTSEPPSSSADPSDSDPMTSPSMTTT